MRAIVKVDPIEVDKILFDFVAREALPGTGVEEQSFWKGFASLVSRLAPRNAALLAKRDRLQAAIDAWHRDRPGAQFDAGSYRTFLTDIGGNDTRLNLGDLPSMIESLASRRLYSPTKLLSLGSAAIYSFCTW